MAYFTTAMQSEFFFLSFDYLRIFRRENKILYYTFTVWHKLNTWKYEKKNSFSILLLIFFAQENFLYFSSLLCILYIFFLHIRISTATYTLCIHATAYKSRKRMNNFSFLLLSRYDEKCVIFLHKKKSFSFLSFPLWS